MEPELNGADIDVVVAGQQVKLRNIKSLNTVCTIITLVIVTLLAYAMYLHQQDSRDATSLFLQAVKEQTVAMKDSTVAQREQTCMMRFDQVQRQGQVEFCKSISR